MCADVVSSQIKWNIFRLDFHCDFVAQSTQSGLEFCSNCDGILSKLLQVYQIGRFGEANGLRLPLIEICNGIEVEIFVSFTVEKFLRKFKVLKTESSFPSRKEIQGIDFKFNVEINAVNCAARRKVSK